jgi:hypothetical protein
MLARGDYPLRALAGCRCLGEQLVKPGSMITVTEGSRVVAYFTVQRIADS